jgi:methyltransferase-like protein
VKLDEFNRQLLILLDGTRDRAGLIDGIVELVASRTLAIMKDDKPVTDLDEVRTIVGPAIDENLVSLARAALFPE